MKPMVREAALADVDMICQFGTADIAFAVSEKIRFYERQEIEEWIATRGDNLLLVVEYDAQIAGFLFCKIMSYHWAMLDNFYVSPKFRGQSLGKMMLYDLELRLKKRRVQYLSTLVEQNATKLSRYIRGHGFTPTTTYCWHEKFLGEPTVKIKGKTALSRIKAKCR